MVTQMLRLCEKYFMETLHTIWNPKFIYENLSYLHF